MYKGTLKKECNFTDGLYPVNDPVIAEYQFGYWRVQLRDGSGMYLADNEIGDFVEFDKPAYFTHLQETWKAIKRVWKGNYND